MHYRTVPGSQSRKVFTVDDEGQHVLLAMATFNASTGRFTPQWLDEGESVVPMTADQKAEVTAYVESMTLRQRPKAKAKQPDGTSEPSQPEATQVALPILGAETTAMPVQTVFEEAAKCPVVEDVTENDEVGLVEAVEHVVRTNDAMEVREGEVATEDELMTVKATNQEKLAIFCEGDTEKHYLAGFVDFLGIAEKVHLQTSSIKDPGAAFKQIASEMLWDRQVGNAKWSEAWLVFDRDGHVGYYDAFDLVEHFPFIHLAFTNPCFEYWLLLHEHKFDGVLPNDHEIVLKHSVETTIVREGLKRVVTEELIELTTKPDDCLELLKRFEPGFKKGARSHFEVFGPKLAVAYEKAKTLGVPNLGSGTGLVALVDRLCEIAGRKPADVMAALKTIEVVPVEDNSSPLKGALKKLSDFALMALAANTVPNMTDQTYRQVRTSLNEIKAWVEDHAPKAINGALGGASVEVSLKNVMSLTSTLNHQPMMKNTKPGLKSWRKLYRASVKIEMWLDDWERLGTVKPLVKLEADDDLSVELDDDVPF